MHHHHHHHLASTQSSRNNTLSPRKCTAVTFSRSAQLPGIGTFTCHYTLLNAKPTFSPRLRNSHMGIAEPEHCVANAARVITIKAKPSEILLPRAIFTEITSFLALPSVMLQLREPSHSLCHRANFPGLLCLCFVFCFSFPSLTPFFAEPAQIAHSLLQALLRSKLTISPSSRSLTFGKTSNLPTLLFCLRLKSLSKLLSSSLFECFVCVCFF